MHPPSGRRACYYSLSKDIYSQASLSTKPQRSLGSILLEAINAVHAGDDGGKTDFEYLQGRCADTTGSPFRSSWRQWCR